LRIPKRRTGSDFPSFLGFRRMAEKALKAVIQDACIQGVSTRSVDDPVMVGARCSVWTSAHPIERLNGGIKRRTDVIGIVPNFDSIVRWVGALLLEQNDGWAVQRSRDMTRETIATMSF